MENNYDDVLFSVLKDCKTLPVFLDQIFGFLRRRTDFYHVATQPNSPIGLPAGFAECVVKDAFYKWMPEEKSKQNDLQDIDVGKEVEIKSEMLPEKDKVDSLKKNVSYGESSNFSTAESYNGAVYENYSWSQNISDIDIVICLPVDFNKKDLNVVILSDRISIKLQEHILLEGELCQKCKHNDALWSLEKRKIQIHLDKFKEMWWNCLVKSEPKLDLQKLDCSRPFEDLPEEAQAKIQELQWNQEQKRLGLPSSDEILMQETLKKAWHVEGSPFSGPFDPSTIIMQ